MNHTIRAMILIPLAVCAVGCSDDASEASAEAGMPPFSPAIPDRREQAYTAPDDAGPGMARLMDAYEAAPKIPGVSNERYLGKWTAWVEERMPDAEPVDRAYAAHVLALAERIREGGPPQLTPFGRLAVNHRLFNQWARDRDGDGTLSDAEIELDRRDRGLSDGAFDVMTYDDSMAYGADGISPDDVIVTGDFPPPGLYSLARGDADADGRLSEGEWRGYYAGFINEMVWRDKYLIERIASHKYDADGDGHFGPDEQEAFDADHPFIPASISSDWIDPKMLTSLRGYGHLDMPVEDVAPPIEGTRPLRDLNDVNGDGVIDDTDRFGSEEVRRAYVREQILARREAAYLGMVAVLDTDGDKALSAAEWERGQIELPRLHERNVLYAFYDTNTDGRISDPEIIDFMRWHDNKGLRADANFDGQVDHRDVIAFVEFLKSD